MSLDFYDGITEKTDAVLKKMQVYVDLALKQGDAVHQERAGQLIIDIRVQKEKKDEKDK